MTLCNIFKRSVFMQSIICILIGAASVRVRLHVTDAGTQRQLSKTCLPRDLFDDLKHTITRSYGYRITQSSA